MRILKSLYYFINTVSLDVCAGAVCCSLFFAKVSGTTIDPFSLIVLFLSVWLIYTVDHIRDSAKMDQVPSQSRHRFHLKYRKPLLITVALVSACNLILLFYLSSEVIIAGVVLGVAIGLYLVLLPYINRIKEILVALFYTAGILVPVWYTLEFSWKVVFLIVSFFLLALMNLVLFSLLEKDHDRTDNMPSLVILCGEKKSRKLLHYLFILVTVCFLLTGFEVAMLVIWTMALIHYIIFLFQPYFIKNEKFRMVGDAAFLLPLFFVIFS